MDESNDIKDTAQFLIVIRGINDRFEITEEFLTMESLKGKTRGQDLYDRVSAVIERMNLPWSKLANVTTDGFRARGLQHRQFISFLEETDADHQDLLYHSRVRWLSLGKVFQRMWELKGEINTFLELVGKSDEFPELSDKNWLCDCVCCRHIFPHE